MAHDVFVSYASGDKLVADAVVGKLEANNIRCWIAPRDVLPGVHYGEAIIDAIHECRIMVLVFSSKANLSGHIPKEIERAVSGGVTVMPLRIEDVTPAKSLDYFIGSVHWLDALTPPLEVHLQKLAANVKTLLARGGPGADIPPQPPIPMPVRPSPPPETHTAAEAATPAIRSPWAFAVIGGLTAIILILGFALYWLKSQGRNPPIATSANVALPQPLPSSVIVPVAPKAATLKPPPAVPVVPAPLTPKRDAAAAAAPLKQKVLRYVPGSTVKLEQLLGEQDKERHQPTRNQTFSRYGLQGADLGYSFDSQGHIYFLFGVTVGRFAKALGTIATSDASDPESGVKLDFLTNGRLYLGVETSDEHRASSRVANGELELPVSGISLGGQMYVVLSTDHPLNRDADMSVLTKFVMPSTFQPLRTISQQPSGRFIRMSMHAEQPAIPDMPAGGPFVISWGTGSYRRSYAYLSLTPQAEFESGHGTRFYAGSSTMGTPSWSDNESDAKPIVDGGSIGDLSVTWCKDLGLWLMTYDSREPENGIVFSYSRTPWGPWSEPQVLFNVVRDAAMGKFIHNPQAKPDDGLAGPVVGFKNQDKASSIRGGAYAPYVVERWTKVQGSELELYYVVSTVNPYVVVLMKSRLKIE